MDNNEKARAMIEVVNQCVDELIGEGKQDIALQTQKAFEGVPIGSLARLFDIMTKKRD